MFLTDEEKRMRDGAEGDAVAAAMDLLSGTGTRSTPSGCATSGTWPGR